jgi:glycosyltransferase involved in cell wall biosynthesis
MVAALRNRGVEAEIATTDDDAGTSAPPFSARAEHSSVPVRFFPRRRSRLQLLHRYAFSPLFASWLERHAIDYDLLHVHALFSHLPGIAMRIARRHGVPYISRPLGQLGRWPLRQSALQKKLYLRLIESRNLRDADAIHFVSESERAEAQVFGSMKQGIVIPHGMDLPVLLPRARETLRSQLHLPADQKLVLFLGRLHPKKGIDWLLRALAQLPAPRPILLLAGEGDYRAELERLAVRLGIEGHLRWLGHVEGAQKQLCLQGADLFALTSHHENFGVAVLEALAAGASVLVSDQVALGEGIRRHRLGTVVPLEIAAIRAGLALGLAPPAGDDATRRRAFVREHYSWPENARALDQLYRQVLQDRTGRNEVPRLQHACPTS